MTDRPQGAADAAPAVTHRLRLGGIAAIAVLWTTLPVAMLRTGLGVADDRPLSYLGTDPRGIVLFRVGLLVAAVLFSTFALAAARGLARPASFLALFLGGQLGQVVVALVPIDSPSQGVHTTAGIVLGLSLPLLMWRFAAGQPAGPWRRLAYRLMGLEVVASVAGVALSMAGAAVVAEVLPATGFHLWVILVGLRWPAPRPSSPRRDSRIPA